MTIRKFLDLSTAHLTPATRQRIDDGEGPATAYPHPESYGWLIYVDESNILEIYEDFPDLLACMKAARQQDCDYILFDRDGPAVDYLTQYADDGSIEQEANRAALVMAEDEEKGCNHSFVVTDQAGRGEGRSYCEFCGADGDA